MFARSKAGLNIAKESWAVLRQDKELLVFPILSFIACLAILATVVVPFLIPDVRSWAFQVFDEEAEPSTRQKVIEFGVVFLIYFIEYFVVVFFNTALVGCAMIRFSGGNPTVADGLKISFKRMPQVLSWALVAATVGSILSAIESKSEAAGRWAAKLVGVAWSIATYFVVPVLAAEGTGPLKALRKSAELLKKTWGEGLTGNFAISFVGFLFMIPVIVLGALGIAAAGYFQSLPLGITAVVTLFGFLIVVLVITSALKQVFLAALYMYASDGTVPSGFSEQVFADAFKRK